MRKWPDARITDLLGIELPIIQAPMAGSSGVAMAIAVSEAGGLGSLPSAQMTSDQLRAALARIKQATLRPVNVNFFAHTTPAPDEAVQDAWRSRLRPYYLEHGLDPDVASPAAGRAPFDETFCALVQELRPNVVSFHFGLPEPQLVARVKAAGAKVISSATTVAEAVWLESHGADAIIAMGYEAGGHRGNFLTQDMSRQVGTMALVPQVVDAVKVPVIAAGGIADGRGVAAAAMLGASAVQIGTAYLFTPEAEISVLYREALRIARDDNTAVTNLFTGRPARGIVNRLMRELGPLSEAVPPFPTAGGALAPLRAKAEAGLRTDFTNLWSGQSARLAKETPAAELTRRLHDDAIRIMNGG